MLNGLRAISSSKQNSFENSFFGIELKIAESNPVLRACSN
jgi:hypothetical protein